MIPRFRAKWLIKVSFGEVREVPLLALDAVFDKFSRFKVPFIIFVFFDFLLFLEMKCRFLAFFESSGAFFGVSFASFVPSGRTSQFFLFFVFGF